MQPRLTRHNGPVLRRRGAAMILMVFMFVAMTAFAFLTLNISLLERHHAAGQISADLASRATVDELSRSNDTDQLREVAESVARANWSLVGEAGADSVGVNVEFGNTHINNGRVQFQANQAPYNAVRVALQRDVNMVGFAATRSNTYSVQRDATSAIIERDLCLVLDRSGSMNFDLATGTWLDDSSNHPYNPLCSSQYSQWAYEWWYFWPHPDRSRWSTMVPAIYALTDELSRTGQQENFAMVSYSSASASTAIWNHSAEVQYVAISASSVESPMVGEANYLSAVAAFDHKYKYVHPVAGATDISAGIDMAAALLTGPSARPYAYKTMIVMTDGQYNVVRASWLSRRGRGGAGDRAAYGDVQQPGEPSRHD